MSAREIIASWMSGYVDSEGRADSAIEALTAAGYRIVGPDEVDPVTVERCAKVAETGYRSSALGNGVGEAVAAALRAIASGGKQ